MTCFGRKSRFRIIVHWLLTIVPQEEKKNKKIDASLIHSLTMQAGRKLFWEINCLQNLSATNHPTKASSQSAVLWPLNQAMFLLRRLGLGHDEFYQSQPGDQPRPAHALPMCHPRPTDLLHEARAFRCVPLSKLLLWNKKDDKRSVIGLKKKNTRRYENALPESIFEISHCSLGCLLTKGVAFKLWLNIMSPTFCDRTSICVVSIPISIHFFNLWEGKSFWTSKSFFRSFPLFLWRYCLI